MLMVLPVFATNHVKRPHIVRRSGMVVDEIAIAVVLEFRCNLKELWSNLGLVVPTVLAANVNSCTVKPRH